MFADTMSDTSLMMEEPVYCRSDDVTDMAGSGTEGDVELYSIPKPLPDGDDELDPDYELPYRSVKLLLKVKTI